MINPEGFRLKCERFQRYIICFIADPGLSLRSNPGLKLANAFGVFFQLARLIDS